MKKQFTIFILFFCGNIFSQDTIFFKNGDVMSVKVNEITQTEIKYNRYDNQTGPLYTSGKYEITQIKYANGEIEKFNLAANPNNNPNNNSNNVIVVVNKSNIALNDKLIYSNRNLFYHNRGIDYDELSVLIDDHPNIGLRKPLKIQLEAIKKLRRNQIIFGVGGPALGLGIYLGAYFLSRGMKTSDANFVSTGGFIVGLSVYIFGNVAKQSAKAKRYNATFDLVKMYNE